MSQFGKQFSMKSKSKSAIYVERVIQTAYLFNIADLALDLNGSPYLMTFIKAFEQYIAPQNERELIEAIRKMEKYLLPEGKVGAEAKRQKLITEVNKLVPKVYVVPSHRSIGLTLQFLKEDGYIVASKNKSKTLWSINPDFYQKWSARRHQLFDKREQKMKEFQNTNTPPDQAEINANDYVLNKYGTIVLDFYNIKINTTKPNIRFKESLYLRYRVDVDFFLP